MVRLVVTNAAGFCLAWNQQRPRSFPELVIRQFQAALSTGEFLPDHREGIATLVDLDPSRGDQAEQVEGALAQLNRRSASARNRESAKDLYGYSRLLDLERLLYGFHIRNDNTRHGHGLGTAVLSAVQLR